MGRMVKSKLRHIEALARGGYEAPATTGTPNRAETVVTSALEIPPPPPPPPTLDHDTDPPPPPKKSRPKRKKRND